MSMRLAKPAIQNPATKNARQGPSAAELRAWIEQAAYYRAEKRGFAPGAQIEDWTGAEAQIMARMN
jgi:hypothetical protein